jgi:hypothetical protein
MTPSTAFGADVEQPLNLFTISSTYSCAGYENVGGNALVFTALSTQPGIRRFVTAAPAAGASGAGGGLIRVPDAM